MSPLEVLDPATACVKLHVPLVIGKWNWHTAAVFNWLCVETLYVETDKILIEQFCENLHRLTVQEVLNFTNSVSNSEIFLMHATSLCNKEVAGYKNKWPCCWRYLLVALKIYMYLFVSRHPEMYRSLVVCVIYSWLVQYHIVVPGTNYFVGWSSCLAPNVCCKYTYISRPQQAFLVQALQSSL